MFEKNKLKIKLKRISPILEDNLNNINYYMLRIESSIMNLDKNDPSKEEMKKDLSFININYLFRDTMEKLERSEYDQESRNKMLMMFFSYTSAFSMEYNSDFFSFSGSSKERNSFYNKIINDEKLFALTVRNSSPSVILSMISYFIQNVEFGTLGEEDIRKVIIFELLEKITEIRNKLNKYIVGLPYNVTHLYNACTDTIKILKLYFKNYDIDYIDYVENSHSKNFAKLLANSVCNDSRYFINQYNNIKRSPGYQQEKFNVVSAALKNRAIDEMSIDTFKIGLTKSFREELADCLHSYLYQQKSTIKSLESRVDSCKDEEELIEFKESLAYETDYFEKLKTFATQLIITCESNYVTTRLYLDVGKENCIFIMPIVANTAHSWNISRFESHYGIGAN